MRFGKRNREIMRDGFEERGRWSGLAGAGKDFWARMEQRVRWGGLRGEAGAKLRWGRSPTEERMPRMLGCLDAWMLGCLDALMLGGRWIFAGSG
jgi:hypothetical protein